MKRIFILLLVITGLYIAFNQFNGLDLFGGGRNKNDEAAITKDTEIIKVDVGSVSTTIIPEDRMNLRTEYEGKQRLTVKENGDEVEVSLKGKRFNWFNWGSQKSKLKIYIPEDYNQEMLIDLGSGKLDFSGQSKNKPMKLEKLMIDIGSGNMNLRNLEVKELYQDVSSGNVNIDSIKTEKGVFDVSSGNLDIDHFSGGIAADVSSGRLAVQVDQLTDSIQMGINSGLIDLDLPEDADFTLNGEISSGKISCDLPLKDKVQNKDRIQGKLGSGKHAINLDVSSGIINMK